MVVVVVVVIVVVVVVIVVVGCPSRRNVVCFKMVLRKVFPL